MDIKETLKLLADKQHIVLPATGATVGLVASLASKRGNRTRLEVLRDALQNTLLGTAAGAGLSLSYTGGKKLSDALSNKEIPFSVDANAVTDAAYGPSLRDALKTLEENASKKK